MQTQPLDEQHNKRNRSLSKPTASIMTPSLIETLTLAEEALRRYNFRYAGCEHAKKNRELGWRAHAGIVAHLAHLKAQASEPSVDDFAVALPPEAGQMIEDNFAALALPNPIQ